MIPQCLGPQYTPSDQTTMTVGGFGSLGVVPGVFYADAAASTSATTGALASLKTFTLPANALNVPSVNANTRGMRVRAWGQVANNANAKSVQLKLGAGAAVNVTGAITASQANLWSMDVVVLVRTFGAAGALSVGSFGAQGAGTPTHVELDTILSSFDLTATMVVVIGAGNQTAGSDVTCDGAIVELF